MGVFKVEEDPRKFISLADVARVTMGFGVSGPIVGRGSKDCAPISSIKSEDGATQGSPSEQASDNEHLVAGDLDPFGVADSRLLLAQGAIHLIRFPGPVRGGQGRSTMILRVGLTARRHEHIISA